MLKMAPKSPKKKVSPLNFQATEATWTQPLSPFQVPKFTWGPLILKGKFPNQEFFLGILGEAIKTPPFF